MKTECSMPAPSDRERLLKLVDESARVVPAPSVSAACPGASPDPAPLSRPQVVFQIRESAARAYDRVRAAVTSPEADRRFPLATATLILFLAAAFLFGVDRWRLWSSTREVTTVGETEAMAIREQLGLKLVGIDWSEVPVALVENTATGKTHFLRQGDSVGGARVQLIFKDKVIFNTPKGRIALR